MIELAANTTAVRLPVLLAIFGLVVVVVMAVASVFNRRFNVRAQLQSLRPDLALKSSGQSLRSRDAEGAWARMAAAIEAAGLNLTDTKSDRLREKLRAAGYNSPAAPRIYTLVRLLMIFVLPLGYVILSYMSAQPPSFTKLYVVGSGLAVLGLLVPNLFVQAKADRRKEAIVNGFPDCLDLLLVCVESGLGLEAAMDRVGREMVVSQPMVAQLLSLTVLQLRAGASREEAFRKLADAASVDEIRSFTTLLIQSDKLGTSIASTMRVYASEMREKRRMRAEEKAYRLPVLISIPLVACMLPVMIGTLMLPAVVMVVRELYPMMRGG
ncbi:MAG: type II secretion system F family protein [Sphingomonadales bacterium]|nr:type II secretion system F family protein [Sphingomonadales bacterium]MBU3992873.1 type II secretion system F family protein [Alphaproteobacteria bacterium]